MTDRTIEDDEKAPTRGPAREAPAVFLGEWRAEGNGRRQDIAWEWRPAGEWLPLCDRVATPID